MIVVLQVNKVHKLQIWPVCVINGNRVYEMFIVNFVVDYHAILSNCTSWKVLSIIVIVSISAVVELATTIYIKSAIEIVILSKVTLFLKLAITFTTKLILVAPAPTTTYSMTVEIISKSHGRTIARNLVSSSSWIFRGWQLKFLSLLNPNRLSKWLLVSVFEKMLFILFSVHLVGPILPLKLLSLIELNDDCALLAIVFEIKELLLLSHSPSKVTLTEHSIIGMSSLGGLLVILFLYTCKTRLREYVFAELSTS